MRSLAGVVRWERAFRSGGWVSELDDMLTAAFDGIRVSVGLTDDAGLTRAQLESDGDAENSA